MQMALYGIFLLCLAFFIQHYVYETHHESTHMCSKGQFFFIAAG